MALVVHNFEMSKNEFSSELTQFIFKYVDSVELLEVLLHLRGQKGSSLTAQKISDDLRTNPASVAVRLTSLKGLGFVNELDGEPTKYIYNPSSPKLDDLANQLAEAYKVRRYSVLDLIFSPTKRIQNFVDAFVLRPDKKDDSNG